MNLLITNPRGHREAWMRKHPGSLVENGGLLSREDFERWACDICMAPLDPDKPIKSVDDYSLCDKCAAKYEADDFALCQCEGCAPEAERAVFWHASDGYWTGAKWSQERREAKIVYSPEEAAKEAQRIKQIAPRKTVHLKRVWESK